MLIEHSRPQLDIVIPVYNEGASIMRTLSTLARDVQTSFRILLCYDFEDDDTLQAIRTCSELNIHIRLVRNRGVGAHKAVTTGFSESAAPYVLVYAADDDYNSKIIDEMVARATNGADIVCASRFLPGGCMEGCPWIKALLVRTAAISLYFLARLPSHDPTNGFRLFSRRVIERISIESDRGFTYSLELLVKCHRLGWTVAEVPARWYERTAGKSRFRVFEWLPAYMRWYFYAFATTFLRRSPATVPLLAHSPNSDTKGYGRTEHPA